MACATAAVAGWRRCTSNTSSPPLAPTSSVSASASLPAPRPEPLADLSPCSNGSARTPHPRPAVDEAKIAHSIMGPPGAFLSRTLPGQTGNLLRSGESPPHRGTRARTGSNLRLSARRSRRRHRRTHERTRLTEGGQASCLTAREPWVRPRTRSPPRRTARPFSLSSSRPVAGRDRHHGHEHGSAAHPAGLRHVRDHPVLSAQRLHGGLRRAAAPDVDAGERRERPDQHRARARGTGRDHRVQRDVQILVRLVVPVS